MASEFLTNNDEVIKAFFYKIDNISKLIDGFIDSEHPILFGERYLTDKEVSDRLQVARRTLQDWRNKGVIGYVLLGGKVIYRESDIVKLLTCNYNEPFRNM